MNKEESYKKCFQSSVSFIFLLSRYVWRCVESENALASYAAEDCLGSLSTLLGPNILR